MVKIVSTTERDLDRLAACHNLSFPKSLASALGKHFVKRMLSWYLSSDKSFLFHIEGDSKKVIGYCGGLISDGSLGTGSASGMTQHSFWHAVMAFITRPWLLFHPEVLAKWPLIWKNILTKIRLRKKSHFTQEQKLQMSIEPKVGLVVIGVDPAYQGQGYGSLLLQEFESRAKDVYNIPRLQLTVHADNIAAIKAYKKNGWERGVQMGTSLEMKKNLSLY